MLISATEPDWSREAPERYWDPGRRLLKTIRSYERWRNSSLPYAYVFRILAVVRFRIWSTITGAEIPLGSKIGGGLLLPHPNGVVVHSQAIIGPNCLLLQQVTVGLRDLHAGVPHLEGNVDVGAGAKILGSVRIGAHAKIGANAVVLCDVPAYSTAVGIPAKIINCDEIPR